MTANPNEKRILYHGPSAAQLERLLAAMHRLSGGGASDPRVPPPAADLALLPRRASAHVEHAGVSTEWLGAFEPRAILDALHHRYINLVVFDLRAEGMRLAAASARALEVLDALDRTEDVEERYAFHRIVVLVPGCAGRAIDEILLRMGARGVQNLVREPSPGEPGAGDEAAFAHRLLDEVNRLLRARRAGKRALCSAGGGITGIFFEQGALKCLDDCLGPGAINRFDMYFGISAGAVVNGPLAAGYSIDEYMAAIAGEPGGRMPQLDLRLFRLGHLNLAGVRRRLEAAARTSWGGLVAAFSGRGAPTRESLLFDYADLVGPPFRADRFEEVLRAVLTAPGATNDFRRLPRPLFVGATDQDARRHVLFGDEAHRDVPISLAIQASLSINPAFSATPIEGRFYEDGAVTRTSNFVEAIHRGATLVVVLDPFVPYVARTPGFADARGVLYNIDQDVRTISYTRYETTRNWVLRKHPEVSTFTFVPANRLRRLMSVNPMDHRPFAEIWRGAYVSTLNRVRRVRHRLAGDLAAHGFKLDLARAEAVAARLEAARRPRFADFFPDGKVQIRREPLCLEGAARDEAVPAAS